MVLGPNSLSRRRAHLEAGNLLRSLTEVIDKVPGGINLGQGVCDLELPEPLAAGVRDAVSGGDRQVYTPYAGLPELRERIAAKLREFNRLQFRAEDVVVTVGSSAAFYASCAALFDPGDEVVLFEPFYSYHRTQLLLLGLVPVAVALHGPEQAIDLDELHRRLGPRTRGIVVNTPGNPSGKVFTAQELAALGELLDGRDTVVLTDEVYEYLCFDGRAHVSPGTVESLHARTVTIGGFSKTFSITGWRIGYVAAPTPVADAIGRVCDQIAVCAPRPLQRGVARALAELPPSFYSDLRDGYQRKRDQMVTALRAAGFAVQAPQGAYYVLADYREVLGDLEPYPAVLQLIERARINAVPGDLFYAAPRGVRTLRLHFAVQPQVLDEVCARLAGLA